MTTTNTADPADVEVNDADGLALGESVNMGGCSDVWNGVSRGAWYNSNSKFMTGYAAIAFGISVFISVTLDVVVYGAQYFCTGGTYGVAPFVPAHCASLAGYTLASNSYSYHELNSGWYVGFAIVAAASAMDVWKRPGIAANSSREEIDKHRLRHDRKQSIHIFDIIVCLLMIAAVATFSEFRADADLTPDGATTQSYFFAAFGTGVAGAGLWLLGYFARAYFRSQVSKSFTEVGRVRNTMGSSSETRKLTGTTSAW